jgi:hypothetical protein
VLRSCGLRTRGRDSRRLFVPGMGRIVSLCDSCTSIGERHNSYTTLRQPCVRVVEEDGADVFEFVRLEVQHCLGLVLTDE